MDKPKIIFIMSGGTLDSEPYPVGSPPPKYATPVAPEKSLVRPMAEKANCELGNKYELEFIAFRNRGDSQKFDANDLIDLAKTINEAKSDKVVVTHGTDWMPFNVRFMMEYITAKDQDKKVIFTGSFLPLSNGEEVSDGKENIKLALTQAVLQKPGVHIAICGKVFDPRTVEKNKEKQCFYDVKEAILHK